MEWSVLIIAAVCAVTAIIVAYMVDRRSADERKQILSSPPDQPLLASEDVPTYLTEKDVRRPRRSTPAVPQEDYAKRLEGAGVIEAGWSSPDFITDPASKRAIVESPIILVAESVGHMADLVDVIRSAQSQGTGVVVVASEVAEEVVATLVMNSLADKLACVCVITGDLDTVAAKVGATVVSATDLRSGYLPQEWLGHCDLWVSDEKQTWILPSPSPRGAETGPNSTN